jgi:hypothetical protein
MRSKASARSKLQPDKCRHADHARAVDAEQAVTAAATAPLGG